MSHTPNEHSLPSSLSTPRWVKVLGIIALVLALLVGIMLLSGGEHSASRHMSPASTTDTHTPPMQHGGQ
jgi:TRAP-type C4-dicarboxylate transport system permease small subunit